MNGYVVMNCPCGHLATEHYSTGRCFFLLCKGVCRPGPWDNECMRPHCKCMQDKPCSNHHYSDDLPGPNYICEVSICDAPASPMKLSDKWGSCFVHRCNKHTWEPEPDTEASDKLAAILSRFAEPATITYEDAIAQTKTLIDLEKRKAIVAELRDLRPDKDSNLPHLRSIIDARIAELEDSE